MILTFVISILAIAISAMIGAVIFDSVILSYSGLVKTIKK